MQLGLNTLKTFTCTTYIAHLLFICYFYILHRESMERAHTAVMALVWSDFCAGFCIGIIFVKCACIQDLSTVVDLKFLYRRSHIMKYLAK